MPFRSEDTPISALFWRKDKQKILIFKRKLRKYEKISQKHAKKQLPCRFGRDSCFLIAY